MDCYTDAEYAVSETIVLIRKASGETAGFKAGYLFGHKLAELAASFGLPNIKNIKRSGKASQALERFQQQAAWRTTLNHGAMTVYASREGFWLAEFKMIIFADMASTTTRTFVDEARAQEMLVRLKSSVQSLVSNLQHFRAELELVGKAPSITPSAPVVPGSR